MLFTGNVGAKTQCLSKEIGVGVVIPCWPKSQFIHDHVFILNVPVHYRTSILVVFFFLFFLNVLLEQ